MGNKPKPNKIKPWRIPDCDRWDGSPDDETFRHRRFVARFRVEFDGRTEHYCWCHLAAGRQRGWGPIGEPSCRQPRTKINKRSATRRQTRRSPL